MIGPDVLPPEVPIVATIRDIARRADVSVSTVSLALRGDARVRATTRERILEVAESLNYRPMLAARSLSSGKTWTVDVLNPASDVGLTSSFSSRFLHGVHDTARGEGYSVALRIVDAEDEAFATVQRLILERATDGVILMNPSDNEALVEHLADSDFPHVLLGRAPRSHVRSVDNDNVAVAADATEHLVARGRTPILFLCGPDRHTFALDRLRGHREALARHGLEAGDPVVTDGTAEAARRRVRTLLQEGASFRSVMAIGDLLAVGAMRGVRDAGRRIPDDVAVMGMNNDDLTEYTDPPLTSIELGAFELGRHAAGALLALLRGDGEAEPRVIVPHRLVSREST